MLYSTIYKFSDYVCWAKMSEPRQYLVPFPTKLASILKALYLYG
jgi:hypothetical protein